MKRRAAIVVVAALAAAACAPSTAPAGVPAPSPAVVTSPTALIRPLNAYTLADLDAYAPIDLGRGRRITALSPDQHWLAVVTWEGTGDGEPRVLHLVDLAAWTDSIAAVPVENFQTDIQFSPAGDLLYWVGDLTRDPARAARLYRYDVARHALDTVAELPSAFRPQAMRPLQDGRHVAVYGRYPQEGFHIVIVDLAKRGISADLRIPDLIDGQITEGTGAGQQQFREYHVGLAWDIPRDRIFVVDGASDRLTLINLIEGTIVRQGMVGARGSWLGRLRSSLILDAEAKWNPGVDRRVALSPDGERLFITGLRREMRQSRMREVPMGLQVVATRDFRQVARLDLPVSDLALAPDGRRLLLSGASMDWKEWPSGADARRQGSGLHVLDTDRLKELAHLGTAEAFTSHGFSGDGRHAYVSRVGPAGSGFPVMFSALDLKELRQGPERPLDWYRGNFVAALARP